MVRVEFLNGFSDRGPRLRKAVAHAVEALRSDRNVIEIPPAPSRDRKSTRLNSSHPSTSYTLFPYTTLFRSLTTDLCSFPVRFLRDFRRPFWSLARWCGWNF